MPTLKNRGAYGNKQNTEPKIPSIASPGKGSKKPKVKKSGSKK